MIDFTYFLTNEFYMNVIETKLEKYENIDAISRLLKSED